MSVLFGHHELHSRYRFEGQLILETPLRLSSGRASDKTDAPLMRDREGNPYIPGSSLRGAIRSAVERIVAGVGQDVVGFKSCTLFSSDDCNEKARQFQKQEEDKRDSARTDGAEKEKRLADFAKTKLCDVCKLFGATIYASRLVIEDACPKSKERLAGKTIVRDGVGIDRDTGTAKEGVKFDYEVLETGPPETAPKFTLHMQVENMTDKDRLLLNLILGLLKQGIHVGGKQAAGLGKIRLESWNVKGFETARALWDALTKGEDPQKPLTWQEDR